jgi:hypothetical protein
VLLERVSSVLADIAPPNLYTLRGPRRAGKSTLIKQTSARLIDDGVDPRRICYFAADALATHTDLINLFQAARLLFPDLADTPRFFLIDEVTAIPEWQRGVKWLRDNTPVAYDCLVPPLIGPRHCRGRHLPRRPSWTGDQSRPTTLANGLPRLRSLCRRQSAITAPLVTRRLLH